MIVALLGHYLCFWADARTGTTGTLTISEAQISCQSDKFLLFLAIEAITIHEKILKRRNKKLKYLIIINVTEMMRKRSKL